VQVWLYEDTDEQWKEFSLDIQAMLEAEYSNNVYSLTWQWFYCDRRIHTVNFETQPMVYMVKCGDTIKLSTKVERRVMHGEYLCRLHNGTVKCIKVLITMIG
jgi:fructosamine-3-kinase